MSFADQWCGSGSRIIQMCMRRQVMRAISRGNLLTTEHIWFESFERVADVNSHADRVILHGHSKALNGGHLTNNPQNTLIMNLNQTDEELRKGFDKSVKWAINKAKKEGTQDQCYDSAFLLEDPAILHNMSKIYSAMYMEKEQEEHTLPVDLMLAYARAGGLYVSVASIDGDPVVYHSYVTDGSSIRSLHSCSEFRSAGDMRNRIGRANKYLHYQDMRRFRSLGMTRYDWGGVFSFDEPNGIDEFKLSFGGAERVVYYNIIWERTLRCRIRGWVKERESR